MLGSGYHRKFILLSILIWPLLVRAENGRPAGPITLMLNATEISRQLLHAQLSLPVNSSHHQAAQVAGEGLQIVARCPQDGIIEALEGSSPDHFVVAVQWHPERSVEDDQTSRAIFRALVEAAKARYDRSLEEHAIRG